MYGSFGTQNLMVTLIFKFDPRKGQAQVKLGQIRPNFKIHIFKRKYAFLVQICLRIPKMPFIFFVRQLEMPKNAFQKCDFITFTCFLFGHCTVKNKDIALKFCMRVVCMYLDHIYSVFWIT